MLHYKYMKELKPILLHTLELLLVFGVAYLATQLFGGEEVTAAVTAAVVGAIAKAGRVFGNDYVNK